jgi:ATP-dependent Clp protease ATP-binding subunit ClpC
MKISVADEVKDLLAREGFDRTLGARPLRRAIQRLIEDPLSEALLFGKFREGDVIEAVMDEGDVTFRQAEELAPLAR